MQYCDTVPVFLICIQIQEFVGSCHRQFCGSFFVTGSFGLLWRQLSEGSHGNLLGKVDEEKTLKVESLVKLLGAVKASFPGLQLLPDSLVATANISDRKGMSKLNFH